MANLTFTTGVNVDGSHTGYVRVGHNTSAVNNDAVWSFTPPVSTGVDYYTGVSATLYWNNSNTGSGWSGSYTYVFTISTSGSSGYLAYNGSAVKRVTVSLSGTSGTASLSFTGLSLTPGTTYYIRGNHNSSYSNSTYKTMKSFYKNGNTYSATAHYKVGYIYYNASTAWSGVTGSAQGNTYCTKLGSAISHSNFAYNANGVVTSTYNYNSTAFDAWASTTLFKAPTGYSHAPSATNWKLYNYTKGVWISTSGVSEASLNFRNLSNLSWGDTLVFFANWKINSYKLTVVAGTGGTVTGGGTYNYGASYTIKATASTGYTFSKWTYSAGWSGSNTNTTVTGTMPATAGTATASFTANTYSVTLNNNQGSGGTTAITATYAANMPSATMPKRSGYTFQGYYDTSNATGGTQYYTATGASARTWNKASNGVTLYARWGNPTSYNLTLDANGGKFQVTPFDGYSETKNIFSNWRHFRINENSFLATNKDGYFSEGENGITYYVNNTTSGNGDGTSTVTRILKQEDNPFPNSTHQLQVDVSKGLNVSYIGFVQTTQSIASNTFIHLFVAKLPQNYYFSYASNATGDGRKFTWLTPQQGTGKYEVYAYQLECGSTGTFKTFGHVYVQPNNTAFTLTFYVAYSEVYNITSPQTFSIPYDTLISDLPIPVKSGYRVKTWYTNYTGSGKKDYGRARMFTDKISIHLQACMNNWVEYATGNDANDHYQMRAISCTEGGGWNIESADGYIRFQVWDAGANSYVGPTANVKFEELESGWHTFDMTFDGTNWRGYVDGELIATSQNFVGNIGYNTTNGIFVAAEAEGDQTTARYNHFVGQIGNVIILNDDDLISTDENRMMIMPGANTTITVYWERANHINVYYNNEWSDVPIYVYHNNEWQPAMINVKNGDDWEQP